LTTVRSVRARSIVLAFALLFLALNPNFAASAPGAGGFTETWEDGLAGWTVTGEGASVDCAVGNPGCSLRLALPAGTGRVAVDRSLDVPLTGVTSLLFSFRPDSRYGYTDTHVRLFLDTGTELDLILSDGGGCCNAYARLMSSERGWGPMGDWSRGGEWHAVGVYVDPVTAKAQGALWDPAGVLLGLSPRIPIAPGATAITGLRFDAVESYFPDSTTAFHYDTIRIGPDAFPPLPTAPQGLSVARGYKALHLAWQPPVETGGSPIVAYEILGGDYPHYGAVIGTVNGTTLTYTDDSLGENAYRSYRVRAVNEAGQGALSDFRAGTTYGPPRPPYNLRGAGGLEGNLLSWDPADGNGFAVVAYRVYRLNASSNTYEAVGEVPGNRTRFVDEGRNLLGVATYTVTTVTPRAESYRSREATAYVGKPGHPRNLTTEPHEKRIDLDWDAPEEQAALPVLSYTIYRLGWVDGYDPQYAVYTTMETRFEDVAVDPARYYRYHVEAVSAAGPSDPSDEVYGATGGPPSAPRELQMEQVDRNQFRLTWSPPEENEETVYAYTVERKHEEGEWEYASYLGGTETSFTDSLWEHGRYTYRVQAYNGYSSPYSEEVSFRYNGGPLPPQNLQATAAYRSVALTWEAPPDHYDWEVHEYCFLRSSPLEEEKSLGCVPLWTFYGTGLQYTDYDVVPGINYTYRITANTWWGETAPSRPASATVAVDALQAGVAGVIDRWT